MAPRDCAVVGRWRIVASDLWGRDDLDLVGLATMVVGERGQGEITVGALTAALDLEYARTSVFFRWHGSDDMTEVSGDGAAVLQDDGSLEIELNYQNGDDVILKAVRRAGFSTAC